MLDMTSLGGATSAAAYVCLLGQLNWPAIMAGYPVWADVGVISNPFEERKHVWQYGSLCLGSCLDSDFSIIPEMRWRLGRIGRIDKTT
jgi:hypothetical protein